MLKSTVYMMYELNKLYCLWKFLFLIILLAQCDCWLTLNDLNSLFAALYLDPRERLKEDDLDVILSPQRRSFGGGCQGIAAPVVHTCRPISPLENKENETLRLGGPRRIGSGRIMSARAFERESRVEKERDRERDFKDKRFRVGFIAFSPSIIYFLLSLDKIRFYSMLFDMWQKKI